MSSRGTSIAGLIFRRDIMLRSLRVAAVVGTVLILINHGQTMLDGVLTTSVLVQIVLTYCVPYAVATYASVRAVRSSENKEADGIHHDRS